MSVSNHLELITDKSLEAEGSSSEVLPNLDSKNDELLLQQLVQARFWHEKHEAPDRHITDPLSQETLAQASIPNQWNLTRGIALHGWQQDAINAWIANGNRGVIKVVTGAGKTMLGLAIAERLQHEEGELHVAIIVPTTVLLHQWRSVLAQHSNLPSEVIGLMGGGHNDSFDKRVRVLICVLNSASKKLPAVVEKSGVANSLLLIVDECHRAGAAQMQQVFKTRRQYNLGLSATPERDDESAFEDLESLNFDQSERSIPFEESTIGRELGDVVFEMNYAQAIRLGVLPPFMIIHYGLSLLPTEREKYERLSREIKDLRSDLETGKRRGLALIRWCRSKAAAGNPKAARLISLTTQRKQLLYRMKQRSSAVLTILQSAFEQNPDTKAILFHESIDEVMSLFSMLRNAGFPVVAEHSDFPDEMRAESLRLFREGRAQVIVSARSLIEGFNMPSADLGIIVAASSSVRQRVQTLGRLLRKVTNEDGAQKEARLYVLYASQTVDDRIYEKADWKEFVGADRNEYFLWSDVNSAEPVAQIGPPRVPPTNEADVDVSSLRPGEIYPGNTDEGKSYSLDTQGNVSDENGKLIKPSTELQAVLRTSRKKGGRFRVTPTNQFVIELSKTKSGWVGIYLGQLTLPLRLVESDPSDQTKTDYLPGDIYPIDKVEGKTFSVLQRDKRLIAKKTRDGVFFVRDDNLVQDASKRNALKEIQAFLGKAYANGQRLSKITVTREGHVVYAYNNEAYFVGYAPEGAEGFEFEHKVNDA
jgi:superfamily II DNA or RNA helicase